MCPERFFLTEKKLSFSKRETFTENRNGFMVFKKERRSYTMFSWFNLIHFTLQYDVYIHEYIFKNVGTYN